MIVVIVQIWTILSAVSLFLSFICLDALRDRHDYKDKEDFVRWWWWGSALMLSAALSVLAGVIAP